MVAVLRGCCTVWLLCTDHPAISEPLLANRLQDSNPSVVQRVRLHEIIICGGGGRGGGGRKEKGKKGKREELGESSSPIIVQRG